MAVPEIKLFGKWTYDDVEVSRARWRAPAGGGSNRPTEIASVPPGLRRAPAVSSSPPCSTPPTLRPGESTALAEHQDAVGSGQPSGRETSTARVFARGGRSTPEREKPRLTLPPSPPSLPPQVNDLAVQDYIAVKTGGPTSAAVLVPHTAGRYQKRRFRKAQCPIVER